MLERLSTTKKLHSVTDHIPNDTTAEKVETNTTDTFQSKYTKNKFMGHYLKNLENFT